MSNLILYTSINHQLLIFPIILFKFWFGLTMRVWLACFFWIRGIMNACKTLFRWTLFASFRCAALPKTRLMLRLCRFLPWFTSQLDTTFSSPAQIAPSVPRLSMLLRQWPHFSANLFLFFNRKATKCSQWSQLHPFGWGQSIEARSKFNGTWSARSKETADWSNWGDDHLFVACNQGRFLSIPLPSHQDHWIALPLLIVSVFQVPLPLQTLPHWTILRPALQ